MNTDGGVISEIDKKDMATAHKLLSWLEKNRDFKVFAPIDVEGVARELGVVVKYEFSLKDDAIGEIFIDNNGDSVIQISLSQNSYVPRRRFTLAHEIGHYCLHRNSTKKIFVDSQQSMSRTASYWDIYESAANNFAAQLLMPKNLILDEGVKIVEMLKAENDGGVHLDEFILAMAEKFEVSNQAMEYRLNKLLL